MRGKRKEQQAGCRHPPERLYSGVVDDPFFGPSVWAACCDCGEVIREGYSQQTLDAYARQQAAERAPLFAEGQP